MNFVVRENVMMLCSSDRKGAFPQGRTRSAVSDTRRLRETHQVQERQPKRDGLRGFRESLFFPISCLEGCTPGGARRVGGGINPPVFCGSLTTVDTRCAFCGEIGTCWGRRTSTSARSATGSRSRGTRERPRGLSRRRAGPQLPPLLVLLLPPLQTAGA